MASFVMKFLWCDPTINFDIEHWDDGLVNFGRTTFRQRPRDSGEGPPLEPTRENGFIEVEIALSATDLSAAKREAWEHWKAQPYGNEAEGYVIQDAMAQEDLHQFLLGWDDQFDPTITRHPVNIDGAALHLFEQYGADAAAYARDKMEGLINAGTDANAGRVQAWREIIGKIEAFQNASAAQP
jgi:hypothetical protein